jgi:hypothetical protein
LKKAFFISNEFDYNKLICSESGPEYARNMGWPCVGFDIITDYQNCVNIIDIQMTERECLELQKYIVAHKSTVFLLTIVDPGEYHRAHWYYRFLFDVYPYANVYFLSKYLPAGLVAELDALTHHRKIVFIPYPFQDPLNTVFDMKTRKRKVIFSGAVSKEIYPLRAQFQLNIKRNPLLWQKVDFLGHPGYVEVGQKRVHDIIGIKYWALLSQYVFMFLDPSRYGLELMKNVECAYARCVPIGTVPESFTAKMREPFLEVDYGHFYKSINKFFSMPDTELRDRSNRYYDAMASERDPIKLNKTLDQFIETNVKL